jgi:hypothetical protein
MHHAHSEMGGCGVGIRWGGSGIRIVSVRFDRVVENRMCMILYRIGSDTHTSVLTMHVPHSRVREMPGARCNSKPNSLHTLG